MTDPLKPFSLRLATSADLPGKKLIGLDTRIEIGPGFSDAFDLVEQGIGANIPQGSLLAYLVRRFGFPNIPSDPHKDLVAYLLNTSHPEMLMKISPYTQGNTSLTFTFLTAPEIATALRSWPFRARDAHRDAFPDWLAENDLIPEWMEEAKKKAATEGYCDPSQETASLTQTLRAIDMSSYLAQRRNEIDPRAEWLDQARKRYESTYPVPPVQRRQENWQEWPEDDPMKPYAAAIATTLAELTHPVWVRDMPIDPSGPLSELDAIQRLEKLDSTFDEDAEPLVADVAGRAVGAFANRDPEGFSDLMTLVHRLGKDDIEEGFAKAYMILSEALSAEAK